MPDKPFSSACQRNREPILAVLREHFADRQQVLEIGSGTGQHAVHFAAAMPWLVWQCSDVAANLLGIRAWLDEAGLANVPEAVELDVTRGPFIVARTSGSQTLFTPQAVEGKTEKGEAAFDAAFSANTLHIMGWAEVEAMFAGLDAALADDATLAIYGPFNVGGDYSSHSNREFDGWLKARDPDSGIRDVEAVDGLARAIGFVQVADQAMPANNRVLVWRRRWPANEPPL